MVAFCFSVCVYLNSTRHLIILEMVDIFSRLAELCYLPVEYKLVFVA